MDLVYALPDVIIDNYLEIENNKDSLHKVLKNIRICLSWEYQDKQFPIDFRLTWNFNNLLPDFKIFKDKNCYNEDDRKKVFSAFLHSLINPYFKVSENNLFNDFKEAIGIVLINHVSSLEQFVVIYYAGFGNTELRECNFTDKPLECKFIYPSTRLYSNLLTTLNQDPMKEADYIYNMGSFRDNGINEYKVSSDLNNILDNIGQTDSKIFYNLTHKK